MHRRRPAVTPMGAVQLNDVFVGERGIVYTVDFHMGGLYILEMDFKHRSSELKQARPCGEIARRRAGLV